MANRWAEARAGGTGLVGSQGLERGAVQEPMSRRSPLQPKFKQKRLNWVAFLSRSTPKNAPKRTENERLVVSACSINEKYSKHSGGPEERTIS